MIRTYKNIYGELTLISKTKELSVTSINRSIVPTNCFCDLDKLEEVALITGNRNLQLVPDVSGNGENYIIFHLTEKTGMIMEIDGINFRSDINAEKEIEHLNCNYYF